MTWLTEIWRSKLKFGLLAAAVGLLFFLLLFVNTLSSTLLDGFIGAIENMSADVLVFDAGSQVTIPASRLTPDDVSRVRGVEGVASAAPISELTTDASLDGRELDVSVWGIEVGGPGDTVRVGRRPSPRTRRGRGRHKRTGGRADRRHGSGDLGCACRRGRRGGQRHIFGSPHHLRGQRNLGRGFRRHLPASSTRPDQLGRRGDENEATPSRVAAAISDLDGLQGLTPGEAASTTPGVSSIEQSFGLITGITFAVVIVVVGFFFQILTVQKLRVFALLEALGSSVRPLAGYVLSQIGFLVTVGVVIGAILLAVAAFATREVFAISIDPALTAILGGAILMASLVSGITSIRRISKQDAAGVATGGTR